MQAFNPYLPSWEYIPDGEPHIFDGRLYVYGSHDRFRGHVFCLNDYVCWSAPADNLADWRYEGVIYRKTDDPDNPFGRACLYAPDVTRGPDGRYYLYYVLDKESTVAVAVCDQPAGKYEFYGHVHDREGNLLGLREGDEPQFDPGVLTENGKTWLYTGFCSPFDSSRHGPMCTLLGEDMLTIEQEPVFLMPSKPYSEGSGYEGHEFFEASSIRKFGDLIVSNNDIGISSYKPAEKPMYYGGNNHGGLVQTGGKTYIFYHRQTDGTTFSRQGMAQEVALGPDGAIPQAEMTSCGLNGGPLEGRGTYPAYIACNLFTDEERVYSGGAGKGFWMDGSFPRITQDGRDGDEEQGYIMNMTDSATCGFKYFDCQGVRSVTLEVRGYAGGRFEVKTAWDGPVLASVPVEFTNVWTKYTAEVAIPDGVQALYFTYRGPGSAALNGFTLG